MKGEMLFEALGNIDEWYLKDVQTPPVRRITPWIEGAVIAASVLVILASALIRPGRNLPSVTEDPGPVYSTSSTERPETEETKPAETKGERSPYAIPEEDLDKYFVFWYDDPSSSYTLRQIRNVHSDVLELPASYLGKPVTSATIFRPESSDYRELIVPEGYLSLEGDLTVPSLRRVVLPGSLTQLSSGFQNCKTLETVDLGGAPVSIGGGAFQGCTALSSVKNTENIQSIGYNAFKDCKSLQTFDFPNGSFEVSEDAFRGAGLTSLVITPGLAAQMNAQEREERYDLMPYFSIFCDCPLRSVTFCGQETYIPAGFFYGTGLEELVIPEGIARIGYHAFANMPDLKKLVLPSTLQVLQGENMFADGYDQKRPATPLTEIEFRGADRLEIGSLVFAGSGLTSVTLPEGTVSLESGAFKNCADLKTIYIPSTVTDIGKDCFAGCPAVITVSPDNPVYKSENGKVVLREKDHDPKKEIGIREVGALVRFIGEDGLLRASDPVPDSLPIYLDLYPTSPADTDEWEFFQSFSLACLRAYAALLYDDFREEEATLYLDIIEGYDAIFDRGDTKILSAPGLITVRTSEAQIPFGADAEQVLNSPAVRAAIAYLGMGDPVVRQIAELAEDGSAARYVYTIRSKQSDLTYQGAKFYAFNTIGVSITATGEAEIRITNRGSKLVEEVHQRGEYPLPTVKDVLSKLPDLIPGVSLDDIRLDIAYSSAILNGNEYLVPHYIVYVKEGEKGYRRTIALWAESSNTILSCLY